MLEVVAHGNGFTWQWICTQGRILYKSAEHFPCMFAAFRAAKAYRAAFHSLAFQVDGNSYTQI